MEDVVAKKIKNRIKFMLVNMGPETNVVRSLKKESGDSEEEGEIENSGNKVSTYLKCFLILPADMQ